MLKLYNLLFTIVSLSLLVVIYLINSGTGIRELTGLYIPGHDFPAWVSYTIYCISVIVISWLTTFLFSFFEKHNIPSTNVKGIESADGIFIPTYLAYVFVGLSMQSLDKLWFCYGILVVVCFAAQIYLFNPAFYLLGYKFYFVTNSRGKKLLIMTRKRILLSETIEFEKIYRINDYTYVEL